MSMHEHISYERLNNGVDLYLLPTKTKDLLVMQIAIPGGTYATYDRPTVAELLETLMPTGTQKVKRRAVRESFERLGAQVSISESASWLTASLTCRAEVFAEASRLLIEMLTRPKITAPEFREAVAELDTNLEHTLDNTRARAMRALLSALYAPGHPHFSPTPSALRKDLARVTLAEVLAFHGDTVSGVGAIVCVAGDIHVRVVAEHMRSLCGVLPAHRTERTTNMRIDRTRTPKDRDLVLSMRDRMNVDTLLAVPLAVTRESKDYYALQIAVAILGGSFSSRLFTALRTRQSLTYGAYASLGGMADGYPGYLLANAIFPNDVFVKGRTALRDEVALWAEKGVTAVELSRRKEEIIGKYQVGLASTRGMAGAVFGALTSGRTTRHIDEYPSIIKSLTLRDVNRAIREHIHYDLAVTSAAGAITEKGDVLR